ncbi:Uncharacterised protein [Enterobacter roggenkampii]|nr:Uncharacterised protein [Enterobacter roggenkampii]
MSAQHLLNHLRNGLVLIYRALPGVSQQRQARTERKTVVRLVPGCGQPFQAGHPAVDIFAASHPEGGIFHQHLFRGDVRLRRGELNVPSERLTQGFPAAKAQNIRLYWTVINIQKITGLSVEKRQPVIHNKALLSAWLNQNGCMERRRCKRLKHVSNSENKGQISNYHHSPQRLRQLHPRKRLAQ